MSLDIRLPPRQNPERNGYGVTRTVRLWNTAEFRIPFTDVSSRPKIESLKFYFSAARVHSRQDTDFIAGLQSGASVIMGEK